jgi:hypothetical protein
MESLKDRRLHNKISQLPKEGLRLIEGKKIDLSLTKNRKEKREIPKLSIVEPHSHENRKEQKKHER